MAETQWYYARNDQQFGPVSAVELKQLADAGRLSPDDLLWREGMDQWATAVNLRGLFGAEPTAATPAPVQAELAKTTRPAAPVRPVPVPTDRGATLRWLLTTMQVVLWTTATLVVLASMLLFARAFAAAQDSGEQAAAAAVSATFILGAYVLARSGEKLARLLRQRRRR